MKHTIALLNDFAHDFFTALWFSALLVLYLIERKLNTFNDLLSSISPIANSLQHDFFVLQTVSLVLVLITGMGRYLNTKGKNQDKQRKSLLIVKHVVLTVVFIGGSYLGFIWR